MNVNDVKYYKPRFEVLVYASIIVLIYSLILITVLFSYNVIKIEIENSSVPKAFITIVDNLRTILVAISFLLGVLAYYGSRTDSITIAGFTIGATTPTTALALLIICANLFVIELFLPNVFLGGSLQSCFGSTLVTMCSLTVIITRAWWVRVLFLLICMVLYTIAAFYNVAITINKPTFFAWCDNATIYMSIAIALLLSWRGEYTIFLTKRSNGV